MRSSVSWYDNRLVALPVNEEKQLQALKEKEVWLIKDPRRSSNGSSSTKITTDTSKRRKQQ
jgi:hypothetical protein